MRPLTSRRIHLAVLTSLLLFTQSATATDIVDVYESTLNFDPVLGAARASLDATEEAIPQTRSLLLPNRRHAGRHELERTGISRW